MSRQPVISISNVSKSFRMKGARHGTLKAALLSLFRGKPTPPYMALQGVSFDVYEGETVGIIGANGSGKSTVLKLITGIIRPNGGTVRVRGRISPLIELSAGFHPEFSGRENIFLNGAMLGVPRKVLEACYDDIVAFSEIGAFIDQPVKTYSSGMHSRLGFAIAIHVNPDILVVDEVLAVGDEPFQKKCLERVKQLREAGKTILLVAHNQTTIAAICDRVIWLDQGVKRLDGPTLEVLAAYASDAGATAAAAVRVSSIAVLDEAGRPIEALAGGERLTVRFAWRAVAEASLRWSFTLLRAKDGAPVLSADGPTATVAPGESGEGAFAVQLPRLAAGAYDMIVRAGHGDAAADFSGPRVRLMVDDAWSGPGVCRVEGDWTLGTPISLNGA